MVAHPEPTMLSVEDYLAFEEASQVRHEYRHGHVHAMSGGTIAHDLIANDVRAALAAHLATGPCMVLGPDVRLRVSPTVYDYPDAMVTCQEDLELTAIEIETPRLVVEVLSESTERMDRGDKFADYQTIAALEEYVLVNSQQRSVERFRRAEGGLWIYQRYDPDASITLESVGLSIPLAAIYRRARL
jgi:Uma2 family endonuclease